MEKIVKVEMNEETHTRLKVAAASKMQTIKQYLLDLLLKELDNEK